jgi:hypothetical protein
VYRDVDENKIWNFWLVPHTPNFSKIGFGDKTYGDMTIYIEA